MKNFRRDIEGKLVSYLHLPIGPVLLRICCFAASIICKGCKFLGSHKERTLALFFFLVETISVVLDLIGKNKEVFLLAAFLLSAFGFAITLYACVEEKTNTKSLAERQLKAVEFVFSVIQLVVTFFQFLFTVLQVNNSYNASAFPLAFAMIAVVFIFKKSGNIDDCDDHSLPKDCLLPLVNLQPIDPLQPISTPIELGPTAKTSSPNQVNPTSPLAMSATHASDVVTCNDHPVSVVLSKNIEVLVPEYGVQRAIDLIVFTCYSDLYKELKTMFSIRLYFNKRPKSHWELIYEDDNGDMFLVGDCSWDVFYHDVRKLYLYKKKSLRNNIMLKRQQLIHDDVSPPPATCPAQQKTVMEQVAAYNPHSSSHILNDIDIEVASNIAQPAPAPAPAPGSVLVDLLEDDSVEGLSRLFQVEMVAAM
ncbi:hypothetical protein Ddye_000347 [Dipteronia dyeriana]|uniref:Auxin-responsive protein n=1 Tax=Dipteronia dyeriana TaxID=168575 RepID=A0AAD9XM24_9ROSI|nr:hypothetical protein Ddye_000347 [Dipteronia dyeriana]